MTALSENPFARTSIAEYGMRLRRGECSAAAATDAFLQRIEALNPKLGAFIFVAPEQARAAAREVDTLVRAGTDLGPLMGVPVAVKDLFHIEGMPLTAGSRLDVSDIVRTEGPIITALKRSGAIILGKTWTSEFALGGINFIQRVPWNPCDAQVHRTPGGSSGGSAVATAAGLCAFALGSDTGGSVRMPAALCGVFGHKFSAAAFPLEGIFPLSPTLDSPGVFTATARDAVTVWNALTAADIRADRPLNALRLGKPAPLFYEELDPEVARALDAALKRLERAGATIVAVKVPEVGEFEAVFGRIVPVELIDILGRERVRHNLDVFDPVTRARFSAVLDAPTEDCKAARARQAALRDAVHARMGECDAWITPTTPLVPGPLASYGTLEAALAWNRRALRNTRPGNVFDQCGVSLPLPGTALPVGLQVLCPAMADRNLLSIACAIEAALSSPE
ncbi:MAG: amidase [Betaproteobacteria bacterium]|nr:amidase [Betaproteobacteria bacterium]